MRARTKIREILCLVLSAPVFLGAAPLSPVFTNHGEDLGLTQLVEANMVPVWLDVTLDGRPEPVWVTHEGLFSVQPGPDGKPSLIELEAPIAAKTGEGAPLVASTVDVDGDGVLEIIRVENYIQVLRVSDVNTLSLDKVPQPTLPGVTLRDMAVGDLNADGLSDIVVGFAIRSPSEKAENSGFPDQILMNIGHGRFELVPVEPSHYGYTNGITLGDVDGDGRLDLVESFNFSAVTFPSRILVNRTEPGARVPSFELLSSSHDTGTSGMGACLGDLNEDGLVDIYNTSIGADQLSLGTAAGVFEDATFERGFRHEWGEADLRSQWSPSFADINGDGLLDVTARHGGSISAEGLGIVGLSLATREADLAYVQDAAGDFHRVPVPFNPNAPGQGRHMVMGDWDGDGLPEIALGGEKGAANFWTNDTAIPEDHRPLTVQLQATVSSTPPTGTIIEGTCGERVLKRTLTWGGKGGGAAAPEHFFAWPGCEESPLIRVQWPSGARSEHQTEPGQTVLLVAEPTWLDASATDVVTVDPAGALAAQACVGVADGEWSCCDSDEEPCSLAWPSQEEGVPLVRLDDAPPMALPRRGSDWIYLTEPSPPRGELPLTVHLMHIGSPESFHPDELSLFVNGAYLPWSKTDEERRILTVYTEVEPEVTSLGMTLYPLNIYPEITWEQPVGYGLDPRWYAVNTYPYLIEGGITQFWKWTTFVLSIRGASKLALLPYPRIATPQGQLIPSEKVMITASLARIRLQVDFDDLEGVDEVVLEDGPHGYKLPLPVRRLSLEEAAATVAFVTGGASNNRLVEGDDESIVYVTLYDGDGHVMPPEAEIVTLEVDGGTVDGELEPFSSTYSMWTILRADEGIGPGEIRVRSIDGRLVGSFPFKRRLKAYGGINVEGTEASIHQVSNSVIGEVTHEVRVTPVNGFNEVVGGSALVEVEVEGGALSSPPYMESQGKFVAPIVAEPGSHPLTAVVWVDGELVAQLETTVNIPLPPSAPAEPKEEDAPRAARGADVADGEGVSPADVSDGVSPARRDEGCQGSGGSGPLLWWALCLALAVVLRGRCSTVPFRGGEPWSP